MKKKDLANLALALGILPHVLSSKKGSRAFGPKVSKYLGLPHITISYSDGRIRETARPDVDIANMWKLAAESTYATGDMILIAIREALQNSLDAIDELSGRERKQDGFVGQFFVVWVTNLDGTVDLILQDNGKGMSVSDIQNRFLVLGGAGGKTQSSRGGFGFAKASILFLANDFEFEIRTRNLSYVSTSFGAEGFITDFAEDPSGAEIPLEYVQGTQLRIKNIKTEFTQKYTSLVLDNNLRSGSRTSIPRDNAIHEWDRIAQFLSLNVFDTDKYNITFFVSDYAEKYVVMPGTPICRYKSGDNQDADALNWLADTLGRSMIFDTFHMSPQRLLPNHFDLDNKFSQRQRPFSVSSNGSPEGIQFMIDGKGNITEINTKQYWGRGSEFIIRGFNAKQVSINDEIDSHIIPVVIAIQGQVQFIGDYRINTDKKLPFRLLFLNLFPTVRAVHPDYPMDVSRLALKNTSVLTDIIKAIRESTEEVKDLFDAFYYKCAPLGILNQQNDHLSGSNDYSESYSDEKYRIIGTEIQLSAWDDEKSFYNYFEHALYYSSRRFDIPKLLDEELSNWVVPDKKSLKQGVVKACLDPAVATELDTLLGGFRFLIPYVKYLISKDKFSGFSYWRNFFISVWAIQHLNEDDFSAGFNDGLISSGEKEKIIAQIERINLLGFTIGNPVSISKAKEIFRTFCPLFEKNRFASNELAETDYFIFLKSSSGPLYVELNSCLYGMNIFNLYVGNQSSPEGTMRKFLYAISMLPANIFCSKVFSSWETMSWWQSTSRNFTPGYDFEEGSLSINPNFYLEHKELVERLLPPAFKDRYPELKNFKSTIWANPLFGLANIRCDYGDTTELVEATAIRAYFIWFCSVYEAVYQLKKKSSETHIEYDLLRGVIDSLNSSWSSFYMGIIFDDPKKRRRGKEKTGIPMAANRSNGSEHTLLINPILWEQLTTKSKDANVLAILLLRTIAHELAHQTIGYHNEEFIMTDSAVFQELVVLGVPITLAEKIIPKLDPRIKAPIGSKSQIIRQQKRAIGLTKNYRYCSRHK